MQGISNRINKRIACLLVIVIITFALLLLRYGWVQLIQGEQLRAEAFDIRSRDVLVEAKRGSILDRNGNELVKSVSVDSAIAYPDQIKERNRREAADKIAEALDLDNEEVYDKLNSEAGFVWLKRRIDFEAAQKIKSLRVYDEVEDRAVKVADLLEENKRYYLQEDMAAHLLGIVGDDNQGLTGFESMLDEDLKGVPGRLLVERDASGRNIPESTHVYIPSVPGKNVILTIDQTIQYFVERELDNIVESYDPKVAVIIVTNPKTGEILALGNRPSYSPSEWKSSPQSVWDNNPAIWYNYEPGSTFKIIVGAASLQEGVVHQGDYFYCPGYFNIADRTIKCWDVGGHGSQPLAKVFQNSCNPGFITMGLRLGKEKLYDYIDAFGLSEAPGLDLPGEAMGIRINRAEATDLNVATMSIGQAIAVTPLQLIFAASVVANGGVLYKPTLIKAITDEDGNIIQENKPQEVRRVISEEVSDTMMKMLTDVVLEGTGKAAYVEGYGAAGKTGTAQVVGNNGYVDGKYVASFMGFSPAANPEIACLVMVAEPKGGSYYGSEIAAPVFSALASDILRYLRIPESYGAQNKEQLKNETPSLYRVPDVLYYPLEEAERTLNNAGFSVAVSEPGPLILSQVPSGGALVPVNTAVTLAAGEADSPGELIMPDLYGLTIKEAGALLEKLGLSIRPSGTGFAAEQYITPGEPVDKGTTVEVLFRESLL